MSTPELGIIALSPAAWTGKNHYPGIAVAAIRAGAIGVLDLEYIESAGQAEQALSTAVAAGPQVGIRCGVAQFDEFQELIKLLAESHAGQNYVILAALDADFEKKSLAKIIQQIHKQKLKAICETVNLEEALLVQAAGADAVIAKGHESGGRVGEETSFVLLQRFKTEIRIPVWLQGGAGINSAAAAACAGAAGVVLDSQLLLLRESPLSAEQKEKLAGFDGTETELLRFAGDQFRYFTRPADDSLKAAVDKIMSKQKADNKEKARREIRNTLKSKAVHAFSHMPQQFALGQDIAFAPAYARKYLSVGSLIKSIREQCKHNLTLAAKQHTLAENSPFALSHGIKYPIVQGAMTRVSDTAEFAQAVAEGGGLPFLALALMRRDEIETLLQDTQKKLGELPWGVGMLGFVPAELRQEQLKAVLKYRPPCALIAGGRPDQAKELEEQGIKTYLHVPSCALLESFVEMGARRFIFEGKECGGHVGPRSSFVLWECMIETLLSCVNAKCDPSEFHIVFAGGIHDKVSAAMVAAMAAPLVERGMKVAVLMGTAYLFTREAVSTGAIVERFQEAALQCKETVLLETGPGHAIRCIDSPYKDAFDEKRKKLESEGIGKNELRQELELMNLGRLRVASKGLARGGASVGSGSKLQKVAPDKQWADGMYMIGQVAAMHDKTMSIKELHHSVSSAADSHLKSISMHLPSGKKQAARKEQEAIAIVGMSCLFPKANDLETYWQNIINRVDTIEEIPIEQFDWRKIYSENPLERDKISSRWGGFLKEIPFEPSSYGIPPSSLASVDPMQMMILEVTRAALQDAGYQNRNFPKNRTSIVLANAGHGPITAFYSLRSMLDWTLSDLDPEYRKELEKRLPEWTEDSFPGYLGNVVAGRVANRFDLGGINFCVDAACASSLAALYIGIKELRAGSSDVVLLAATDTHNQPGDYLSFSKTHALSPRGRCRTFDAGADGIVISEGMAVLVLKRLSDAERDGDRIYAVIKGIGGSSDGRDLSLTAPRPAGQMLALERAYEDAGLSPSTVELVEAHGTGTVAGDRAEVEALKTVFESYGASKQVCAIGSVKTMIGHTKCAAGLASVIKVARSLYHKVLPPTMGVENPNPSCNFAESPFYVNAELRPWLHDSKELGYPRRAGVSAFGFGGTNFHTVLEEYVGQSLERQEAPLRDHPSEVFVFQGSSRRQILKNIEQLIESARQAITASKEPHGPAARPEIRSLFDLAYRHHLSHGAAAAASAQLKRKFSLCLIASSLEDLEKKLGQAKETLQDETKSSLRDPRGIYFAENCEERGLLAFLFPGQGSQQPNMLRDLMLGFNSLGNTFELADKTLEGKFADKLSRYIYPTPAFSEEERKRQAERLTDTHVAQPAVAAADMAAYKLLTSMGLEPELCAGHSFGEYVALAAAGSISESDLYKISEARGAILKSANGKKAGSMTAVAASGQEVRRLISHLSDVTLANLNSPKQCIISGDIEALSEASRVLDENKVRSKRIAVSAAFHSPLMEPAQKLLSHALLDIKIKKPELLVYSNTLAKPYPTKPEQIASLLCEHLVKPVEFQKQIEQMYEDGARIFIECGPGAVLTGLVDDILAGKEHLCLSLERNGKHGLSQLQYLLAQAFVAGLNPDFGKLYRHRNESLLTLAEKESGKKAKLQYLINGSHVKRYDGKIAVPANRPTEHAFASTNENVPARQTSPGVNTEKTKTSALIPTVQKKSEPSIAPPVASEKSAQAAAGPPPAAKAEPFEAPKVMMQAQSPLPKQDGKIARPAQPPTQAINLRASAREQVMMEFQKNLLEMTNAFLQTQEKVMLAFLEQKQVSLMESPQIGQALPAAPAKAELSPRSLAQALKHEARSQNAPVLSPIEIEPSGNGSNGHNTETEAERNSPSAKLNPEQLIQNLIEIVSERTGYPPEMLDPDLDLEADLGIDSIKRVEILNSFRKLLPESVQTELESGIEKLAGTRTLSGIMDWIRNDLGKESQAKSTKTLPSEKAETFEEPEKNRGRIGRALVRNRKLDFIKTPQKALKGLYLISDDEGGLADSVAEELKKCGAGTLILKHRDGVLPKPFDETTTCLELDLCREDLLKALSARISESAEPVAGLIHLLPLKKEYSLSPQAGLGHEPYAPLRTFFVMLKELLAPLGAKRELRVIATTELGGDYAESAESTTFNPVHASIPGVIKCYAREYPQSVARCLDFSPELSKQKRTEYLLAELAEQDKALVEVGYTKDARLSPEACAEPLSGGAQSLGDLDASSVILVTGGARGITAEICLEIAEHHKSNFVIVGRGQRPQDAEDPEFKGLTTQREIKAKIMEKLRKQSKPLSVPAVEAIYQSFIKEREIRENLARLEASGARVHYYSLDVRDHAAFSELIDKLYESFGSIDAVIHGAGVIEDAYIKDKSLASFDRVYGTKVDAALTLASRLQLDTIKYLIFFSSVVGRTGNAGQCDYVAANETVNKLAIKLNRMSKGRVLSIGWGPWRGGMAQPELESLFARFGWSMIEPGEGRSSFYAELMHGKMENSEILLVGQLKEDDKDSGAGAEEQKSAKKTLKSGNGNGNGNGNGRNGGGNGHEKAPVRSRGARINRAEVLQQENGKLKLRLKIDPEFDIYLKDHAFDGTPVLPMAVACELISEAAQFMYPKKWLLKVENLDIPAGIMFDNGARDLYINLEELENTQGVVRSKVELCTSANSGRKNFMAQAVLADSVVETAPPEFARDYTPARFKSEEKAPTAYEIYSKWLFHGPLFQGIEKVDSLGLDGIAGELRSTPLSECLKESAQDKWIIDPLLVDSAMQLAGVWARHYMDITVLPTGFKSLHILASPQGEKFKAIVWIPEESKNGQLLCDMGLYDEEGKLVLLMQGLGGVGSKSFNRLAQQPKSFRVKP